MLQPGTLLSGRYRIEKVLGQGGMGAVYLARIEALANKAVAIKEMSLHLAGQDDKTKTGAIKQFQQEASFLANLDHPNLVQVTDFFEDGGRHYLVMAYIQGTTLADVLTENKGALPIKQVMVWAQELCSVLGYLHGQTPPILFRDLKPSNIMIDHNNRVRLIDFGLARAFHPEGATATFLQGFGSSGYAPLEQYEGAGGTDPRSDIYALGATLYHVLTDSVPPSPIELISSRKGMPSPRTVNNQLPVALEKVLMKTLAMRREERYSSMQEVARALEAIDLNAPVPAEDFTEQLSKPLLASGGLKPPGNGAAPSSGGGVATLPSKVLQALEQEEQRKSGALVVPPPVPRPAPVAAAPAPVAQQADPTIRVLSAPAGSSGAAGWVVAGGVWMLVLTMAFLFFGTNVLRPKATQAAESPSPSSSPAKVAAEKPPAKPPAAKPPRVATAPPPRQPDYQSEDLVAKRQERLERIRLENQRRQQEQSRQQQASSSAARPAFGTPTYPKKYPTKPKTQPVTTAQQLPPAQAVPPPPPAPIQTQPPQQPYQPPGPPDPSTWNSYDWSQLPKGWKYGDHLPPGVPAPPPPGQGRPPGGKWPEEGHNAHSRGMPGGVPPAMPGRSGIPGL